MLVLRAKKDQQVVPSDPPGVGDRWGCLIQDRASRFIVAHASGRRDQGLAEAAIRRAYARTAGRPLAWCADGWWPYPLVLTRTYRRPVRTGRRGHPPLRVPAGVALTQTIKHCDPHGRLLAIEHRATIGEPVAPPTLVHVERLNGVLRDRLACLTRKTHAFAKTAETWDALVGLAVFAHNWLQVHVALRRPRSLPGRRYEQRTPAMALGLTDHRWTWREFFTSHVSITT